MLRRMCLGHGDLKQFAFVVLPGSLIVYNAVVVIMVLFGFVFVHREELTDAVFRKFDQDGNGKIDAGELAAMLSELGLSEGGISQMCQSLNATVDNKINLSDFRKMVQPTQMQQSTWIVRLKEFFTTQISPAFRHDIRLRLLRKVSGAFLFLMLCGLGLVILNVATGGLFEECGSVLSKMTIVSVIATPTYQWLFVLFQSAIVIMASLLCSVPVPLSHTHTF